jgi:ATP-dependent protease Clp ATPase subunit
MAAEAVALSCSFCYRGQAEVSMLIAGPASNICDACTEGAVGALVARLTAGRNLAESPTEAVAVCDFCKKRRERRGLWSSASQGSADICTECVEVCCRIFTDEGSELISADRLARLKARTEEIRRTRSIRERLRRFLNR